MQKWGGGGGGGGDGHIGWGVCVTMCQNAMGLCYILAYMICRNLQYSSVIIAHHNSMLNISILSV